MGLTTWAGADIRKSDVEVAKNYLTATEIEALNRIVSAYLEFAELQAMNRRPMTMDAWIFMLDDCLRLSDRDVLSNAGTISAEAAKDYADAQFSRWRAARKALPEPVDADFDTSITATKLVEKKRPRRTKPEDSS